MTDLQTTSVWRKYVPHLLIGLPLAIAAEKFLYGSAAIGWATSLTALPPHALRHLEYLLLVPLSTIIVAFFRLTLGVQVLSIFRPVLIAIAFQRIGIPLGLLFLAVALGTITMFHPAVKDRHYYVRVPVITVIVVVLMVTALIGFNEWHSGWMLHLAYFPVIALCLTCESFASALAKSGVAEALWRAITTTTLGILVLWITRIPGLTPQLVKCPELLISQAGCVLLIADRFQFQKFEGFNPLIAFNRRPEPLAMGPSPELRAFGD